MLEKVKVQKQGITKTIQKKDLPQYIAMGWVEVSNVLDYKKFTKVV